MGIVDKPVRTFGIDANGKILVQTVCFIGNAVGNGSHFAARDVGIGIKRAVNVVAHADAGVVEHQHGLCVGCVRRYIRNVGDIIQSFKALLGKSGSKEGYHLMTLDLTVKAVKHAVLQEAFLLCVVYIIRIPCVALGGRKRRAVALDGRMHTGSKRHGFGHRHGAFGIVGGGAVAVDKCEFVCAGNGVIEPVFYGNVGKSVGICRRLYGNTIRWWMCVLPMET